MCACSLIIFAINYIRWLKVYKVLIDFFFFLKEKYVAPNASWWHCSPGIFCKNLIRESLKKLVNIFLMYRTWFYIFQKLHWTIAMKLSPLSVVYLFDSILHITRCPKTILVQFKFDYNLNLLTPPISCNNLCEHHRTIKVARLLT